MFGIEVFYELRTDACSAVNDDNSLYQCLATWGIIKSIKREDRAASWSIKSKLSKLERKVSINILAELWDDEEIIKCCLSVLGCSRKLASESNGKAGSDWLTVA